MPCLLAFIRAISRLIRPGLPSLKERGFYFVVMISLLRVLLGLSLVVPSSRRAIGFALAILYPVLQYGLRKPRLIAELK